MSLTTYYLSLGSNLGDRAANLRRAVRLLGERCGRVESVSAFVETAPVGFSSPHLFLNAALRLVSSLVPEEMLRATQQIEAELGRTAKSLNGYADRTMDIDMLTSSAGSLSTEQLTLPHPRLHERRFVLEPLCEIAPELFVEGKGYVSDLLDTLDGFDIRPLTDVTPALTSAFNGLLAQLTPRFHALTTAELESLATNHTQVLLLYAPQGLAGSCTVCLCRTALGVTAWLEDVVVGAAFRGRGYGRALVRRAIREARRAGARSLNCTSRPERVAANALYQSEGFERRTTNVYRLRLQ